MTFPRILQNQEGFSTEEYRRCTTSLAEALDRKVVPAWLKRLRNNGFVAGLLMYWCADHYDVVVTVSHRPAMVYGFMNRIFVHKKPVHVAKEFFLDGESEKAPSLRSRILSRLYQFSLKHVQGIIVNATGEIGPYAIALDLPESRFHFIPWPSNVGDSQRILDHDRSILAVGRSLRDWNTFFDAVKEMDLRCIVIASQHDVQGLKIPDNVELHLDVSRSTYLQFLQKSMMVVIPLLKTKRSTGQASFLEAMAYAKPVVVADVIGARDYITDMVNGLTYIPENAIDLRHKIISLSSDDNLREQIGNGGFQSIHDTFNKKAYTQAMLQYLQTLMNDAQGVDAMREHIS
jgi:glycosyltransferase involved in cell wall biosynthesis